MWWNILPSLVITGGCCFMPYLVSTGMGYLWTGSVHGRERKNHKYYYQIFRDKSILGGEDPFRQHLHVEQSLAGIPDD